MKTSQIFGILMIMAIAMSPLITAAETTPDTTLPIEEQTQLEIRTMNQGLGAEIRMLQLQKAVEIRKMMGELVMTKAQEQGKDTAELESIIAELDLVEEEIAAIDPTAEDVVEQFVDLKSDAIELTQQFREKAHELLDEETLTQLREQTREMKQEKIAEAQEIREKIRQHNTARMNAIKTQSGLAIDEVIEKLGNGEITTTQAKEMVRTQVNKMTPEQRVGNYTAMKEESLREQIQARQQFEQTKAEFGIREQIRMQKRLDISIERNGEYAEMIQERIQERIDNSNSEPFSGYGGNQP